MITTRAKLVSLSELFIHFLLFLEMVDGQDGSRNNQWSSSAGGAHRPSHHHRNDQDNIDDMLDRDEEELDLLSFGGESACLTPIGRMGAAALLPTQSFYYSLNPCIVIYVFFICTYKKVLSYCFLHRFSSILLFSNHHSLFY